MDAVLAAILCLGLPTPWLMEAAGGGAEASVRLATRMVMAIINQRGHFLRCNKGTQPGGCCAGLYARARGAGSNLAGSAGMQRLS